MPLRSAVLALFLAPCAALAQPIATDRPDFTESTQVVAFGRVQIEAGATATFDAPAAAAAARAASESLTDLTGPEALVRVGVGRGVEGRLVLPDRSSVGPASLSGASVGIKAALGTVAGVDAATILDVSVSDGRRPSPRVVVMLGRSVGARASVGGQVEAGYDPDARRVLPAATLVGGLVLGGPVATFAEVAVSAVTEGRAAVVLHHGYTLAVGETLQLDVHGGVGVTRTAPDVFVGAGVGVRF